jgi:hypothetical protein
MSSSSSSSSSSNPKSKLDETTLSLLQQKGDLVKKFWYRSLQDIITLLEPKVPRGAFLDWKFIANVFSTLSVVLDCQSSMHENSFGFSNLHFAASDFYFHFDIEKLALPSFLSSLPVRYFLFFPLPIL